MQEGRGAIATSASKHFAGNKMEAESRKAASPRMLSQLRNATSWLCRRHRSCTRLRTAKGHRRSAPGVTPMGARGHPASPKTRVLQRSGSIPS